MSASQPVLLDLWDWLGSPASLPAADVAALTSAVEWTAEHRQRLREALKKPGVQRCAPAVRVTLYAALASQLTDDLPLMGALVRALLDNGEVDRARRVLSDAMARPGTRNRRAQDWIDFAALDAFSGDAALWPRLRPLWWSYANEKLRDRAVQIAFARRFRLHGDPNPALKAVERVLADKPNDREALNEQALCLEAMWSWDRAVPILHGLIALGPQSADLYLRLACALCGAKQLEQAAQAFEKALALDRDSLTVRHRFALFLETQGQHLRAAKELLLGVPLAAPSNAYVVDALRVTTRALKVAGPTYADRRLVEAMFILAARDPKMIGALRLWEVIDVLLMMNRWPQIVDLFSSVLESADDPHELVGGRPYSRFMWQVAALAFTEGLEVFKEQESSAAAHALELALEVSGSEDLASICAFIAAIQDPTHQGYATNAAMAALRLGKLQLAEKFFGRLSRAYDTQMRCVKWPQRGGVRWPHAPFYDARIFEERLPAGKAWPRISIITPSYNQAQYVEETLLSVLNQQYPDVQYIVVDGASSDGSQDILRRYESRLSRLIIERDSGQTEAINKGLALADGEIVTCLNSDDLLAPGALHQVALRYLVEGGDMFVGACLPHKRGRFRMANLPAVTQETFDAEHLADVFTYWMKGYFFYQPEVFFTRALLHRVGSALRQDLYYSMDYELWVRFAKAGARMTKLGWPIAIFRHHEEQKTQDLVPCVAEQCEVRNRELGFAPPPSRVAELKERLRERLRKPHRRLVVYTSRASKIFSADVTNDLTAEFAGERCDFISKVEDLPIDADVIVWLVHLQSDDVAIRAYRARGGRAILVGWFWDNHHHLFENREVGELLDIVIAGHSFASAYLASRNSVLLPSLTLCVTQWSRGEAIAYWHDLADSARDDKLYGGFVWYPFAEDRNELVDSLIRAGHEGLYFVEESNLATYFGRPLRDRFAEWCSHKVSLCLPLHKDLSQRFFDALLAGQIPVIPTSTPDLRAALTPAEMEELPVVTFEDYSVEAVAQAHERALTLFDKRGKEGVQRRHEFALRNMMVSRVREIVGRLDEFSSGATPKLQRDLIFDVGMHTGQDTAFYLKKGFKVVAVEPNPTLVDQGSRQFEQELASKKLTIVAAAIAHERGTLDFFVNDKLSEWSSLDRELGARDGSFHVIKVPTLPMQELFDSYGVPYYLKLDIEGFDYEAAKSIIALPLEERPLYLSVENGHLHFLDFIRSVGYSRFKFVNQADVPQQKLPNPAREGLYVEHQFAHGASGAFGEEAPGDWLDYESVARQISAYWDNPARDANIHGWFDLHCKRDA